MAASIVGVFWQPVRLICECRGRCLPQMKTQLAAASRIQTAWRNRAAPTPPGEPINGLSLALEAHSELKAHEARSATRKPLRPKN